MNSMADSVGMIEKELWDISTYLCIDNDITALVSADKGSVADSNARLWFDEAPMEIVQNMLAIGGNVKTIALYPENGVRPYLRGMDGSVHLQTIDEVRATRPYKKTRELQYGTMWGSSEKKGSDTIFKSSNSDKIVLYRELYDLRRKVPLCFIALSLDRAKIPKTSEQLPSEVYDRSAGRYIPVKYYVEELDVPGYVSSKPFRAITANNADESIYKYRITNTVGQEYVDIPIRKIWEDAVIILYPIP